MANLTGFTPQANPEFIALNFDDGSSSHAIHDPSGEYRQQVSEIVPKVMGGTPPNPMTGAVASNDLSGVSVMGANGPPPTLPGVTLAPDPRESVPDVQPAAPPVSLGVSSVGPAAKPGQTLHDLGADAHPAGPVVGDPSRAIGSALAGQGASQFAPAPVKSLVQPTAGGGEAPRQPTADPYAPRYLQQGGASGPSVTTAGSRTTEGLTDKDKAAVDKANAHAVEGARAADQADYVARANQFYGDWQRLSANAQKQLAEKNAAEAQERDFNTKVDAQRQKNQQTAARPIDPSEAFAGDAGGYAFMAAFGDAISNFGAALAGRGPVADPAGRIGSIIDRSVHLQTQQKQADLDAGKITADQLEADREHVRFKIATAAKQLIETEEQRAHTADEYKGLGALKQRMSAMQDEASAKNALATARKQSATQSWSAAPAAQGGGGVDYFLGEDQAKNGGWKAVEEHSTRMEGVAQKRKAADRAAQALNATWDPKANGGQGALIDNQGKVINPENFDVPGKTPLGNTPNFLAGESGRALKGALNDIAGSSAKAKYGRVTMPDLEAEQSAMSANTDAGAVRAIERAYREIPVDQANVDKGYSPGVANASRLRQQEERGFEASRPGLPASRPATPEALRAANDARANPGAGLPERPQASLGEHYAYSSQAARPAAAGHAGHAPKGRH